MNLSRITRQFYPDEQRVLKSLLAKATKRANEKIKYHYFLVAGLVAIVCTFLATIIKIDFLVFVFGTIAVFGYSVIVFMPYEIYKERKKLKGSIQSLQDFMDKGTVETCPIKSNRIAWAPEFEDESDLYIVELDKETVLYLWDTEYNLNKKFPCLEFEIYEERFFLLTGRQIYPLSEKIRPVIIDKQAKWNYMKRYGVFEHLETENVNFDELLKRYNSHDNR